MGQLGEKWECANCGAKFYDLGKSVPLCPKCGANAKEAAAAAPAETPSRRRRRDEAPKKRRTEDEPEGVEAAETGDEAADEVETTELVDEDAGVEEEIVAGSRRGVADEADEADDEE